MSDPAKLGTVDVSAGGGRPQMRLGDLSGDGRIDLLLAQGDDIDATRTPHEVTALTAVGLDGDVHWQVGDVDPEGGSHGADYPVQVWDVDGDGRNEVCAVMDDRFVVVEGASGEVTHEYALPDPDAHDCIVPADLARRGYRGDALLKDRYNRIWAIDVAGGFELRWTHEGTTGHYPWPHDFDGDGRESVMAGYDFLAADGTHRWTADIEEAHADCIWVADVDGDGTPEILVGEGGLYAYAPDGEELWRNKTPREVQHIAPVDLREGPGLTVAGLDRINRGSGWDDGRDGIFLVDGEGELFAEEGREPGGWLTIIEPMTGWDESEYVLAWRRGGDANPGLYDASLEPVVEFPVDGYVAHADLCASDREQVLVRDGETVHVFGPEAVALEPSGAPLEQPKRLATATLYPGGER